MVGAAEAVAIGLALAPDARSHLAAYLGLLAAGSLLALCAAQSLSGSRPAIVLACGAVLRLTLLVRAPDLSDDVRRYAWDARVGAAGVSPYAHAPADPALAGVAPDLLPGLPHGDVRTVYPPVAQAAFRWAEALGAGALPFKALFAAADLAVVALIYALGGAGAGYAAALYAFHPLPILESAGQGHLDSLGVALLLAAVVYLRRGRNARAGVAFALAVLTKYVPAAAALPLLRRGRTAFAAAALAVGVPVVLAATRGGVTLAGGLAEYATRWEFNAVAYPALAKTLEWGEVPARAKDAFLSWKERLGHPAWTQSMFPLFSAGFLARALLAILLGAALIAIARRVHDTETAVFASLGALLLASPTLHPWYLLWVLPFAARRREPAFLYLSFAVPLGYALLYPVPWLTPPIVYALEYGPFAVLLLLGVRARRARA